jgi:hypothetical protein
MWRQMACISLGVALAVLAGTAFVVGAAKLPPATDEGAAGANGGTAPLPPFAAAPTPAPSSTLVPAAKGAWLPAAEVRGQPGKVLSAGTPALRVPLAADLPPVASAAGTPAPQMPAGLLATAPSPAPSALPPLPARILTSPDRPVPPEDPTARQSHSGATAASPLFRSQAAPFLRLVIPDPFETGNAIELRRVPPDSDPPFSCSSAPPRILLPAEP